MWEWLSFLNTHTYTHLPRLRFSPAWTFFSWQWPVAAWEGKGCQSCISEVLEGPHQVRSGTGSPAQVETKEQKLSALPILTVRPSGKNNPWSWENQALDKAVNSSTAHTQELRAQRKCALKHPLSWTSTGATCPTLSRIVLSDDN